MYAGEEIRDARARGEYGNPRDLDGDAQGISDDADPVHHANAEEGDPSDGSQETQHAPQHGPLLAHVREGGPHEEGGEDGHEVPRTHKNCDIKNFDFVDQNLSKFDDCGVFGKLGLRSIQIWQN